MSKQHKTVDTSFFKAGINEEGDVFGEAVRISILCGLTEAPNDWTCSNFFYCYLNSFRLPFLF